MYTTLKRDVYRFLVEECDWTVLPGKRRCRGDHNIKMDINDIIWFRIRKSGVLF
jgi:hypothetical protein